MFLLLCIHILFILRNIDATEHKFDQLFKMDFPISPINKGKIGVVNVAGIYSRNGIVSTIGGVYLVGPSPSSTQKKTHNWSKGGENIPTNIKIGTGGVEVSSNAEIGHNTMRLQSPWPTLHPMPWPIYNHFVAPNIFDRQRKIEDWLHKNIFENLAHHNQMKNTWIYPYFDPFF